MIYYILLKLVPGGHIVFVVLFVPGGHIVFVVLFIDVFFGRHEVVGGVAHS